MSTRGNDTNAPQRDQITTGDYWYKRPGWEHEIPATVHYGQGDFLGMLMIAFHSDAFPGLLRNVPADAMFRSRTDGQPLPRAFKELV